MPRKRVCCENLRPNVLLLPRQRFFRLESRCYNERRLRVHNNADSEYTIEAAAYSELKLHPAQGTIMPTFHDSWTINVAHNVDGEYVTL